MWVWLEGPRIDLGVQSVMFLLCNFLEGIIANVIIRETTNCLPYRNYAFYLNISIKRRKSGRVSYPNSGRRQTAMRGVLLMAFTLALLAPSTSGVDSTHRRACEQLVTCGDCISGATLYVDGRNETFSCFYCLSPEDNSSYCQGWNSVLDPSLRAPSSTSISWTVRCPSEPSSS